MRYSLTDRYFKMYLVNHHGNDYAHIKNIVAVWLNVKTITSKDV